MNAVVLALISLAAFWAAYRFYGTFLSTRIFKLDPGRITPSHELQDGQDYVPTKKIILFGHHYVSIAGLAPMLGPAIGVIWGWLPALLWVIFGTIFLAAEQAALTAARFKNLSLLILGLLLLAMSIWLLIEGIITIIRNWRGNPDRNQDFTQINTDTPEQEQNGHKAGEQQNPNRSEF